MNLYGASGHAKVIINILELNNIKIDSIFDDNTIKSLFSYSVTPYKKDENELIIAIGDNLIRKKISLEVSAKFGKIFHPKSVIDKSSTIGFGTVLMANSVINSQAKIGKHCIINTNAIIEHECEISDFVHISPSATLCGNVTIGEGTHIGAGATVIPNIKIGKWCTIGAGAVVINDILDNTTVVGNPAKPIKQH